MTRFLFFLAAPVFLVLLARAADQNVITLKLDQDDRVEIQCAPATTTVSATVTVTQTVTSTVTASASGTKTSSASQTTSTTSQTTSATPSPTNKTYRSSLYFLNTFAGRANFEPRQLPVNNVSHVIYAFAEIDQNGEVKSSNRNLDVEKRFATDRSNEPGNNVYGYVKQLYVQKKKNRTLKLLLSIGGGEAAATKRFVEVAGSRAKRWLFAESAAALMGDWGFDGLDLDWEFPTGEEERENFVKLLRACRLALDQYAERHRTAYHFSITVAAPGDAYDYNMLDLARLKPLVDQWNIMTYDFINDPTDAAVANRTAHTTNLFDDKGNHLATPESTDGAVKAYLAGGIAAANISIGLPIFGHFFDNTNATFGSVYNGNGTVAYNQLPRSSDAQEFYDNVTGASYSYDNKTRELISYDSVTSAVKKAAYLRTRGLGGAFFFEATEDKPGNQSLVATVAGQLGLLDPTRNLLSYPGSRYDNIRAGVPGE